MVVDLVWISRIAPQKVERQQSGMAFVQMIFAHAKAKRLQDAQPADAEDRFLFQTVFRACAIEPISDPPVFGVVFMQIGIEEQHRNARTDRARNNMQPRSYPDFVAFDQQCDLGPQRCGEIGRIPGVFMFDLPAFGVDLLAQVTATAQQRDEDHRQSEVGARPDGVAGQHAQAAAVGVHLRAKGDLHRKVGDPSVGEVGPDRLRRWRIGKDVVIEHMHEVSSEGAGLPGERPARHQPELGSDRFKCVRPVTWPFKAHNHPSKGCPYG